MSLRNTQRIVAVLVIAGLLLPTISSAASAGSVISTAADCAKMAFIQAAVRALTNRIQDFIRGRITGAITDAIGLGSVPVKDDKTRSATSATARETQELTKKEQVKDSIARCMARYILDSEILGILNVVREQGRDGGASFVRNWRNFITNAEYRGEGIFRAILASTKICDYMQSDIWSVFGITNANKIPLPMQNLRVGDLDPFRLRQQCTMPDNFSVAELQKDFEKGGGWAAIAQMTEPENNPYWTFLQSYEELERQKALEKQADLAQVQANQGYTGISGKTSRTSCLVRGQGGSCLIYKDIQTPGSYIAASLEATINQELGWFTNADELNEVLLRVFDRLTQRIGNLLKPESRPKFYADPASSLDCREPGATPRPTAPFTPWAWGAQGRTDRERVLLSTIAETSEYMANILFYSLSEWSLPLFEVALSRAGVPQSLVKDLAKAVHAHTFLLGSEEGILKAMKKITDFLLQTRYGLIVQNNTSALNAQRTNILNLFLVVDQAEAIGIINSFDQAAKELATGVDPTEIGEEELPLCETTSTTPSGGGGGGGSEEGGGGEDTWMEGDSLCHDITVDEYEHIGDLRAVQEELEAEARSGSGEGASLLNPNDLDGNNNYKIINDNFSGYMNAVVSRMQSRGYNARDGGEEIQFYRPGDGNDEGNDITTAGGYVRKARDGSSCAPPRF